MSVELLAPCGSYESFLAAVNAGADAVYLQLAELVKRNYLSLIYYYVVPNGLKRKQLGLVRTTEN